MGSPGTPLRGQRQGCSAPLFPSISSRSSPSLLEGAARIPPGPPHRAGPWPAKSMASPMPTANSNGEGPALPAGSLWLPRATPVGDDMAGTPPMRLAGVTHAATCRRHVPAPAQPLCMQRGDGHSGCCTGRLGHPCPAGSRCAGGGSASVPRQGMGFGRILSRFGSHCPLSRLLAVGGPRGERIELLPSLAARQGLRWAPATGQAASPAQERLSTPASCTPKSQPPGRAVRWGCLPCSRSLGQPLAGKS